MDGLLLAVGASFDRASSDTTSLLYPKTVSRSLRDSRTSGDTCGEAPHTPCFLPPKANDRLTRNESAPANSHDRSTTAFCPRMAQPKTCPKGSEYAQSDLGSPDLGEARLTIASNDETGGNDPECCQKKGGPETKNPHHLW